MLGRSDRGDDVGLLHGGSWLRIRHYLCPGQARFRSQARGESGYALSEGSTTAVSDEDELAVARQPAAVLQTESA